jgi:hypothetical protein
MKFPNSGNGNGGGSGKIFVSMKSGDKVKGVFAGDPFIFHQHWLGRGSELCPGKETCKTCPDDKPKFRFRLNFLTQENGVWVAKIYEGGYQVYKALKEMHESDYDLTQTCVTVIRSGDGTDTRYNILPTKDNGGLKPADFKKLSAIPLNDLTHKPKDHKAESSDVDLPEEYEAAGDVPF